MPRCPLPRVRNAIVIARRAAWLGSVDGPGLVSDLRCWLRRVRGLIGLESGGRDRNRLPVSFPPGDTVHAMLLLIRGQIWIAGIRSRTRLQRSLRSSVGGC
jgi:hypothetical protein